MATKNFLSLENLTQYDGLIKQYIGTEDAKSIKSITVVGNTVSFFKTADASGTASYTVNLPDVSGFMDKIASAEGDKVVVSNSNGQVSESDIDVNTLVTGYFGGHEPVNGEVITYDGVNGDIGASGTVLSDLATNAFVGTIPAGATATTVVGYAEEVADALEDSLATVAKSGAAEDVSYDNTDSGLTADDVQGAIDELAEASAGGVASKTVYMVASGSTSDYAQVYDVYQGASGSSASPVPAEKIGSINIPKDKVVESGSVGTVTTPDVPYPGAQVGDKYIELVLQNVANPLYIPANSLVDIYTAEQDATQVQLVIDGNNEISATIVAGSIGTAELTNSAVTTAKIDAGAVTTAKIADDAVTADKVSIAAHTEAQTASTDGLALSVTTTDGQVTAVSGSIAAETYDDYGAAANALTNAQGYTDSAIAGLDASVAQTSGTDGLALSLTEVDGVVTAISGSIASGTYDASGAAATAKSEVIGASGDAASASTVYGAKAYADAATAPIASSDIAALFE